MRRERSIRDGEIVPEEIICMSFKRKSRVTRKTAVIILLRRKKLLFTLDNFLLNFKNTFIFSPNLISYFIPIEICHVKFFFISMDNSKTILTKSMKNFISNYSYLYCLYLSNFIYIYIYLSFIILIYENDRKKLLCSFRSSSEAMFEMRRTFPRITRDRVKRKSISCFANFVKSFCVCVCARARARARVCVCVHGCERIATGYVP